MFENERNYAQAVEALKPLLHDLPGKIVAIGGPPGVGKTTLGRFLAYRFNVSLIETDLFLIRNQGVLIYNHDCIEQIIAARLDKPDPTRQRPVLIEGAAVLRLLEAVGRRADFIIHVTSADAPENPDPLAKDLKDYEARYSPASKADLHLHFDPE
ncbi:AAA family ATPase [Rhodobacterales bacterium]|nr:AAA family ATPase [Rhodobacterales bacterium]